MQYLGDFAEDANVYIPFNTFSSDDPQASVTITNLAAADIHVHKDGSTTEITTDGATIAIDFDGITGNHLITIDTSIDAAYSTGSDYIVRIEGTTVDAATVNAFVASFSIENRYQHGVAQTADNDTKISLIPTTAMRGTDGVSLVVPDAAGTAPTAAEINTEVDTALSDFWTTPGTLVDLVWDEVLTGATHNVNNSSGKRLRQIDAAFEITSGTMVAGSTSTTANLNSADGADATTDEIYAGDRIVIISGTGAGEHGLILSYASSTQIATMSKAWVITPDNTSEYILSPADCDVELWNDNTVTGDGDWAEMQTDLDAVLVDTTAGGAGPWTTGAGGSAPTVVQIRQEMDSNSTQLALIVGDTSELQTNQGNWLTATGFNTVVPPSVAQFNARTQPTADYFDWTTDVVARVTLVDTTTANTDVPTGFATEAKQDIIDTNIDQIEAAVITNAAGVDIAADIIAVKDETALIVADTNELQGDDVPTLIAALPTASEVNAEVVDVLETDTHAEPTGVVAATASIKDSVIFTKTLLRNKVTQNATTTLLRNDADSATIGTSTVSDDTTTFIKGKYT